MKHSFINCNDLAHSLKPSPAPTPIGCLATLILISINCRSSKITVECVDIGLTALPGDIDTSTQAYILFYRDR